MVLQHRNSRDLKTKGFTNCPSGQNCCERGYLMACVADEIIAAPFAIVGSIGVVAQLPNFNRLLKKNDVDFELLTAGKHKRSLTMFGENTDREEKNSKRT